MAKNRKKQREERRIAALNAPPPVPVPPPEPAKPVQELPKVKAPKKRYVRPPRQLRVEKPAALARGTSLAARLMSSNAAKVFVEPESKAAKEEEAPTKQISANDTGPQGLIAGHFQSGRRQAAKRGSDT